MTEPRPVTRVTGQPSAASELPKRGGAGRVKVVDRAHQDPEMLGLDEKTLQPGWHYRWVRSRKEEHGQSVTKHRMKGYTLVKKEEGVATNVDTDDRPDGAVAVGDLVLMKCPQALHDKRAHARRQHTEAQLASTSAVTRQMAKEKGVEIIADRENKED